MILQKSHKVLVQGITGRQGSFWSEQMMACGTNIIGGVNPKKAGSIHLDRPVYASARQAQDDAGFDISVMFIPPFSARDAAIDAIEAGAKMVICLTEHIPLHDVMEIMAAATANGTRIVGPNTAGIVVPAVGFLGIMPGFNKNIFRPGAVGVISRSGSLGALICLQLVQNGYGQSVFYGVGGDAIIGTTSRDALEILDNDPGTDAIIICGEIGGAAEEDAAEYAATMKKPVLSYIAGRSAPKDKKMGHAGAIVTGNRGTYKSKRDALERANVQVVDVPSEIVDALSSAIGRNQPEAKYSYSN